MDWFDNWEMDDVFDKMIRRINNLHEEINRRFENNIIRSTKNPFVYGWSLHIDKDGIPHFREFGTKPKQWELEGVREPLMDIIDEKDKVVVTIEVPGVDKKDIDLQVDDNTLYINAKKDGKDKYHKEIKLPDGVTDDITATYKNGVLDVEIKKVKKKEKKGKKIDIK